MFIACSCRYFISTPSITIDRRQKILINCDQKINRKKILGCHQTPASSRGLSRPFFKSNIYFRVLRLIFSWDGSHTPLESDVLCFFFLLYLLNPELDRGMCISEWPEVLLKLELGLKHEMHSIYCGNVSVFFISCKTTL